MTVLDRNDHHRRAAAFRALHVAGTPLRLANAWDAVTARVVEQAGAAAVGTSSAAVANVLGYADGGALPRDEMVAAVHRIARVIALPLSADIEAGYGATPEAVADTVELVLDAGAVGINLEDGSDPPELLAAKIGAARAHAQQRGLDLFINARTDVYLRGLASGEGAVEETLRRLRLYRDAGADGAFVPLLIDLAQIRTIAAACEMPLNVMVVPGLADVATLAAAGVARVSLGGGAFLASLSLTRRIADELLREGTYGTVGEHTTISHREANGFFTAAR
jgi:2-methylisocitrate lyase-like PEP mutase family enzyme